MDQIEKIYMDYLAWNDILVKNFFNSSMAGREVLLYVNNELINQLGEPYGADVDDFIEAVNKGPKWTTKPELCQKALQTYNKWREKGLEYPPYVGYLIFFVLAAVTETDYAPHSYYPGLRKLMGERQDLGMPRNFDLMIDLWDDLEKWSREDKYEELGRFVARIRGGYIYVGLPRSQTVLSENERKHLTNIFDYAGLDPTAPPSPELIPKILTYYGKSILENRTKILLESTHSDDEVLKKSLIELVLDELEEWDGTVSEEIVGRETSHRQIYTSSLRICLKIDQLASKVETYVRFKTNRPFPEKGLYFTYSGGDHNWHCIESQRGWSKPLQDDRKVKLDGLSLDWSKGEHLDDSGANWRVRLQGSDVRLFSLGIDGLPDWVEIKSLERRREFLIACRSTFADRIKSWGVEHCEQFQQRDMSGLPPDWLLFYGRNALQSCPHIDILTLSTTVRLRLEGGIKAGKRNVYFKFAPPKIVLDNSIGSEKVSLNDTLIKPEDGQIPVFPLPKNAPCGLPLRIEVQADSQSLSKYIVLEEFDLPDSFDTPFRNSEGDIITGDSDEMSVKACGANVYGYNETINYQGPDLTQLQEKIVFIGEKPGEIAFWPDEPYPAHWKPIWAAVKKSKKNWKILFCGKEENLKRVPKLPASEADRSRVKLWKKVVWHRRKKYSLPEIKEVQTIWNDYLRLAKDV